MAKNKKQTMIGGHPVVYATGRDGLGDAGLEKLNNKAHAGDEWPLKPQGPFFVVTSNDCDNLSTISGTKVFSDEGAALKYAKACAQGNVDHRVLRVVEATLVVATDNEL